MTVLDAYAVIAVLLGEPASREVERLLRKETDRPKLSAVNLAEIVDVLVRVAKRSPDQVRDRLEWLEAGGLAIVAADGAIGSVAGDMRTRRYHRVRCPLSLADCFALATAATLNDRLATADPALAAAATTEGVELIGLPDSRGRRPG